ncbi:MAG: TRAP transporter small permease [Comamonas sp.]|jgi:TRAP-type C4-dicarboxylate transport system permease small subunit
MNSVQFVTAVSRSLARLGGLLILVCAFLISLDVVFRNVFKLAIFESYELTGYGIAMATAFGLSWALVTKAHIRIEVIYNLLGIKLRAYLDICALAALSVVAVVLVYYGALVALDNWELGARSNSTLHVPLAIPQGLWLLGLLWFALCVSVLLVAAANAVLRGRHQQVQDMFGIATVSEEVEASMDGTGIQIPRTAPPGSPPATVASVRP